MAYRRRQGMSKSSTFKEEIRYPPPPPPDDVSSTTSTSSSSLAAQAIRASSAHRDSSLSSAYRESAFKDSDRGNKSFPVRSSPDSASYEYTSMKNLNESKYGFWGVLAKKAKSILEDDNVAQQFNKPGREGHRMLDIPSEDEFHQPYQSPESSRKADLQKGLDAITSSLNYIGKSFEEGMTIVENRTADIIQDARKLHTRKKGGNLGTKPNVFDVSSPHQHIQMQADQEMQLKASRDVAMAMTAKAKLLLRELKTVKADLAFAKERSNQLEEENKILRESRDKGDRPEDDDLIRLQLETLLAEKARLANENSIYARENRFLREIVEYHQLTMQDVVYLDEGIEEVTEVYPITMPMDTGRGLSPPPAVSPEESNDLSMSPRPEPTPSLANDVSVSCTPPKPDSSTTTTTPRNTSTSRSTDGTSPKAVTDVSVSPTPQVVPVIPKNAAVSKSSVSGSRPAA